MATILIIDNEAPSRDPLRAQLERAGHQVFAADSAIAGVRVMVSARPELILAVGKPDTDTTKLLTGLRSNPLGAQTPVVVVLDADHRATRQMMIEAGADDCLTQPFTADALLVMVSTCLRRRQAARDAAVRSHGRPGMHVRPAPGQPASLGLARPMGAGRNDAALAPQEARYGTVLFSDIRNFSTLAEALSTTETAEVLHAYFVRACEPILKQGGWIVKLLGDGLLAMFEPVTREIDDHAQRALRAALFHIVVAQRFNTWLAGRFPDHRLPEFAVGIGVHTGDVMVVRVDTGAGIDTTIIGDTVNVASRLEEQTKRLGASVVTTLDTLGQAGARFIPGKRGSLLVRGRTSPVEIAEITGLRPRPHADARSLQTYETIKDALTRNASVITRVRDQVLAEPHRLRPGGHSTPLRPSDAPIKIAGYRLLRRLGQGSMSRSFLAEFEETGAYRVLKVLNINEGGYDLLQRFLQEHEIISQVHHRNVAAIFGHGQNDNHAYIVMEYFPGGDLRQRMRERLPPALALDYMRQVTEALLLIHARGIVHRDLKPDHLMLREDGTLVLADFGIAKNLTSAAPRTLHGEGLGTPLYLSPEQALGKKVDQRCDLYSLGVMFYEMLTGSLPFAGEDPPTLLHKHIHSPVPRLPAGFSQFQAILDRLMAKVPEDRFASSQEALTAIDETMEMLGIAHPREDDLSDAGTRTLPDNPAPA